MKKLTHLQWFKYLANFLKVNIVRNSLECLHIIFVSFIFLMNLIMKSKELEVLYYGQAVFSLSGSGKKLY